MIPTLIELSINPDGTVWGEFQGDHFMRKRDTRLTPHEAQDLGTQIASAANTTLSRAKPIVSVSITYRDRPIRAQVIQPPAVDGGFAISLRFFADLPLDQISSPISLAPSAAQRPRAARAMPSCAPSLPQAISRPPSPSVSATSST